MCPSAVPEIVVDAETRDGPGCTDKHGNGHGKQGKAENLEPGRTGVKTLQERMRTAPLFLNTQRAENEPRMEADEKHCPEDSSSAQQGDATAKEEEEASAAGSAAHSFADEEAEGATCRENKVLANVERVPPVPPWDEEHWVRDPFAACLLPMPMPLLVLASFLRVDRIVELRAQEHLLPHVRLQICARLGNCAPPGEQAAAAQVVVPAVRVREVAAGAEGLRSAIGHGSGEVRVNHAASELAPVHVEPLHGDRRLCAREEDSEARVQRRVRVAEERGPRHRGVPQERREGKGAGEGGGEDEVDEETADPGRGCSGGEAGEEGLGATARWVLGGWVLGRGRQRGVGSVHSEELLVGIIATAMQPRSTAPTLNTQIF
ncbi:hypothetical protein FB451DRAFT_1187304 [Mycena latifolia]|nr:hypothetical protein FB451DRAFT_1187304 [Mycena latifolia]